MGVGLNGPPERRDAVLDRVGRQWALVFARYHPHNRHCALVIVDGSPPDNQPYDETQNDDTGTTSSRTRCFDHR